MNSYRRTRIPGLIDSAALGYTAPIANVSYNNIISGSASGSNTISFSFTVGVTGSNKLLVVAIGSSASISSVTWGATNLSHYDTHIGSIARSGFWYTVTPSAGTNTITVTSSDAGDYMEAAAIDFYNVNQSTPFSDFQGYNSSGGVPNITLTAETGDLCYNILKYWDNGGSASAQSSTTEIWNDTSDGSWQTSGATKAGAASVYMSWFVATYFDAALAGITINKV